MKKKQKFPDFDLIPDTAGVVLNGLYLKKDKSELIVDTAWSGTFYFKPLAENEKSL